jgi:hypothetical protein
MTFLQRAFVQQTADADPEHAEAIIVAAGLRCGRRRRTTRHRLPAKQGATSGTVKLAAKATAARASYDREWSAEGGKTWVELGSTLQSKTTLTGVAPRPSTQFRLRSVTKAGVSSSRQTATLLVT